MFFFFSFLICSWTCWVWSIFRGQKDGDGQRGLQDAFKTDIREEFVRKGMSRKSSSELSIALSDGSVVAEVTGPSEARRTPEAIWARGPVICDRGAHEKIERKMRRARDVLFVFQVGR